MLQGYLFIFFDSADCRIDAIFKSEYEGFHWGRHYGMQYFTHKIIPVSKETYESL